MSHFSRREMAQMLRPLSFMNMLEANPDLEFVFNLFRDRIQKDVIALVFHHLGGAAFG